MSEETKNLTISVEQDEQEIRKAKKEEIFEKPTREQELEDVLTEVRLWLENHLQTNVISRRTGDGGHNGNGNTWAAVAIPDWDVKQKIEGLSRIPNPWYKSDHDTIRKETPERKLLIAAYDALRSYQYGNANTELAEEMADAIGLYFSGGKE